MVVRALVENEAVDLHKYSNVFDAHYVPEGFSSNFHDKIQEYFINRQHYGVAPETPAHDNI